MGSEEILCSKSILCGFNDSFAELIKDSKFTGTISLYEGCSSSAFYNLEKFYGSGQISLDESNVIDLLLICVIYKEIQLLKKCKDYVINHLSINIIIHILNKVNLLFEKNKNNDIKEVILDYLCLYGRKLLYDNIITNLTINALEFILSIPNLIIQNETYLLKQIFNYYHYFIGSNSESIIIII